MNPQLSVSTGSEAERLGSIAAVIASLPVSLKPSFSGGDLQAIAGTPGWTMRAIEAIDAGARGLVVVGPTPEDPEFLKKLESQALQKLVPVVIDYTWASNPGVTQALDAFHQARPNAVHLELTAITDSRQSLEQLRLELMVIANQLSGPLENVTSVRRNSLGFTTAASMTSTHAPVSLSGTVTAVLERLLRVRLLTTSGGIDLQIPDPATARPAQMTVTSPEGALTSPTLFESAHRATWKRLVNAMDDATMPTDISELRLGMAML